MRNHFALAVLAGALAALPGTSTATDVAMDRALANGGMASHGASAGVSIEQRARLAEKLRLIDRIVQAAERDPASKAAPSEQRRWMRESMYGLPLDQLRKMGVPGSYQATADAIARTAGTAPKSLGSASSDLVYVPFAPCRYIDTRNVGGKISGVRAFDTASNGAAYGGSAACDPKALAATANEDAIGAFALNITIVDTSAAGSPGFATMRPAGSTQLTALVNWTTSSANFQAGNAAVVTSDQSGAANEIEILTSGSVHAIVDLGGVFIAPTATLLDCQRVSNSVALTANETQATYNERACPTGYSLTGGGCNADGNQNIQITANLPGGTAANSWLCLAKNLSATSQTYFNNARCCRVPGR
jgi:hypothetical protein